MIDRLQREILRFLQKRCSHPGQEVSVDILEGCAENIQVAYCNRCGSVKTDWNPNDPAHQFISLQHFWRGPDPFLWGKRSLFQKNKIAVVAAALLIVAIGVGCKKPVTAPVPGAIDSLDAWAFRITADASASIHSVKTWQVCTVQNWLIPGLLLKKLGQE